MMNYHIKCPRCGMQLVDEHGRSQIRKVITLDMVYYICSSTGCDALLALYDANPSEEYEE